MGDWLVESLHKGGRAILNPFDTAQGRLEFRMTVSVWWGAGLLAWGVWSRACIRTWGQLATAQDGIGLLAGVVLMGMRSFWARWLDSWFPLAFYIECFVIAWPGWGGCDYDFEGMFAVG